MTASPHTTRTPHRRAHVLVSFASVPGEGSERGVGWEFILAAVRVTRARGATLFILIDARDHDGVRAALGALPEDISHVSLLPVPLPAWAQRRYGQRKTRGSYLAWSPRARRVLRSLEKRTSIATVHQVTFATLVLPPIVLASNGRRIVGPAGFPLAPVADYTGSVRVEERLQVVLGRYFANRWSRRLDTVIAQNDAVAKALTNVAAVEPNVVVQRTVRALQNRDPHRLIMVGHLSNLKRPWISVEALADPRLKHCSLVVAGDGPLREMLEEAAAQAGVSNRVEFLGRITRDQVLIEMAKSRLLLHPTVRDGAAWVVGEAASLGVPSVVFDEVGAATTARMSENSSVMCVRRDGQSEVEAFADGIVTALSMVPPEPVTRWDASRLESLLNEWWED